MCAFPLSIILTLLAPWHIILIVVVILLLFGGKKIPELMRGLGRATREFKDAMNGIEREVRSATRVNLDEETKPIQSPPAAKVEQGNAADGEAGSPPEQGK